MLGTIDGRRALRVLAAAFIAISTLLAASPQSQSAASEAADRVSVIVQGWGNGSGDVAEAVQRVGGRVTLDLPLIDGVSARVPSDALDELRADTSVWQVSRDGKVGFEQTSPGHADTPQRVQRVVRSNDLWAQGITGRGVTVALLDTGVYAAHPDLAGRVIHCEDFSHEAGTEAHCQDTFGHGTFMAGLIAGNGASSNGHFTGAAPEANIVSIKLAGFDGATDVSHVLAGIQWVVAHKNEYGIKVMNLSLGSDSSQSYKLSPLNFAVQKAWKAGIAVVVSAGNSGSDARTILKPADDPYVITVGASNDEGTMTVNDDQVPVFSSRGPTKSDGLAKPDIVAPGVHTVSLRSPGSAIDQQFGSTAVVDDMYFRGTGTSMSAATVTGVVAQMIQAQPSVIPDRIKYRLMNTTRRIVDTDKYAAGTGLIDAYAAARSTSSGLANQGNGGLLGLNLSLGSGLGSLQGSRGGLVADVVTPLGTATLSGEYKAQTDGKLINLSNPLGLVPYVGLTYTLTGWDRLTYDLTSWVSSDWAAMRWKGEGFLQTTWDAMRWKGSTWSNADWEAMRWKDADWNAMRWKATTWQTKWYAAAWD
jgi:serine protease AprX